MNTMFWVTFALNTASGALTAYLTEADPALIAPAQKLIADIEAFLQVVTAPKPPKTA